MLKKYENQKVMHSFCKILIFDAKKYKFAATLFGSNFSCLLISGLRQIVNLSLRREPRVADYS